MIAPTRRLCLLALVPLVPTAVLFLVPANWQAVLIADLLVAAVAVGDLTTLPRQRSFAVRREMQPVATRGAPHRVAILIENRGTRMVTVAVADDRPESIDSQQAIEPLSLAAGKLRRITFSIVPTARGSVSFEHVFVRCRSRLRLWDAFWRFPVTDVLHVHPALKQIGRYALYARANRMSLLGVRRSRRIGDDNEFERLRDYGSDDQFRAIDWRATARRLKITVRDHQANQSQRIVFAVDCGRMMVNRTAGESLLDAALDAALTLAHVALAQRDEAGIVCYDEKVVRCLPPRSGRGQLNRMITATHDVQPRLVESRPDLALLHLQRLCRKRTLVVLITNVIDDRNSDRIREHLAPMLGRHLPLVALLRDPSLVAAVKPWSRETDSASRPEKLEKAGAAADILLWRRRTLAALEADGVLTLDADPDSLTSSLVSDYLAIKARHLL